MKTLGWPKAGLSPPSQPTILVLDLMTGCSAIKSMAHRGLVCFSLTMNRADLTSSLSHCCPVWVTWSVDPKAWKLHDFLVFNYKNIFKQSSNFIEEKGFYFLLKNGLFIRIKIIAVLSYLKCSMFVLMGFYLMIKVLDDRWSWLILLPLEIVILDLLLDWVVWRYLDWRYFILEDNCNAY